MRPWVMRILWGFLAVLCASCAPVETSEQELASVTQLAVLPPNFTDARVAGVPAPTALAFLPDGALLVTTQGGSLRVIRNGALKTTPALNLGPRLCTNSERGLLGVAIDPAFAQTRHMHAIRRPTAAPRPLA